jgi:hypothetical protein
MCSRETESYMRPRRFNPLAISKFKETLKAFYNLDASGAAPADWCLHQVGVVVACSFAMHCADSSAHR